MRKIPLVKENMEEIMRLLRNTPGQVFMINEAIYRKVAKTSSIPRINRDWTWN